MGRFKPMLAGTADLAKLRLPLLGSPKLDGIRSVIREAQAVSRNLKAIPNYHVQGLFGRTKFNGLDGELIVGSPTAEDAFRKTSSGVMSNSGEPEAVFHVFDCCLNPTWPYADRLSQARDIVGEAEGLLVVEQKIVLDVARLNIYEAEMLDLGYEGVMLRDPGSPYKFGRGTVSKQDLLKLKRFADAEARVIGFEELMHNSNEASVGLLGQTERGHSKDGMVGMGTLGALKVQGLNGPFVGVEFNIGTGFDAATRALIWAARDRWLGKVVKYKFFPIGSKDAPRFPVFLGERSVNDI